MPSREAVQTRLEEIEKTLGALEEELATGRRLVRKVRQELEELMRAEEPQDPADKTRRIRPPSAEAIAAKQRTRDPE